MVSLYFTNTTANKGGKTVAMQKINDEPAVVSKRFLSVLILFKVLNSKSLINLQLLNFEKTPFVNSFNVLTAEPLKNTVI